MKDFLEITFDAVECRKELENYRLLLESKEALSERADLQPFFRRSRHLTAYIGAALGKIGVAKQVAYEFELFGDFAADIVIGNREKQFCFIELEDGEPNSVLLKIGAKATKEWGRRFEHGFSQLVDWFYQLDDFRKTDRFQKNFGYGHIDFVGLLLIGRDQQMDESDRKRLRWRTNRVVIDSHPMVCMTFDELYRELKEKLELYAAAFKAEVDGKP